MRSPGTRWFELSGRELRVLLAAAGIVLLTLAGAGLVGSVFSEPEFDLENAREMLATQVRLDVNTALEHELMLLPGIGALSPYLTSSLKCQIMHG